MAEQPAGGSVNLTPLRALVVAALFGGLAGWLLVVTANALDLIPPEVPWTAPIGLILVAALVGALAYSTQQRIQVRRERMEPSRAVAFLVLGKASALAGALVAGGYFSYALMFLARMEAVAPRERVIRSAIALLAGIALCVMGLLLERACKIPGEDDDETARSQTLCAEPTNPPIRVGRRHKVTNVTSPTIASRQAKTPPLRRASEIVLVAGTVIAIMAAFGPTWAVRTGVAVAVVAAGLACAFAWRELFSARRAHHRAMLAADQEHGRAMTEERTRNAAVAETLTGRLRDAGTLIEKQRVVIAELKLRISALRGDTIFLKGEIDHREMVISSLRETVRARESELITLRDETESDVHTMPRRVLAEHESVWDEIPSVDELWTDGSHPTVVDLRMIDLSMVLPNYEVDRKLA